MPKIIPNTATLCKWQSQVCHLHETMSHFVTQPKIPHPTVGCDDPIAPQFTPAGRAVAPRPPPQSAPYGNSTSTVKNRNAELLPSGTSHHLDSVGTKSSRQEVRYQKAGNEMSNLYQVYVKSMSNFFNINFTIQPRLTFPTASAEGPVPAKVHTDAEREGPSRISTIVISDATT